MKTKRCGIYGMLVIAIVIVGFTVIIGVAADADADSKLLEKYELSHIVLSCKGKKLDPNTLIISGTVVLADNKNTVNTGALECWMTVETSVKKDNWKEVKVAQLPSSKGLEYGGGVSKHPASFKVIISLKKAMTKSTKFRITLQNTRSGDALLYVTGKEYKRIKKKK